MTQIFLPGLALISAFKIFHQTPEDVIEVCISHCYSGTQIQKGKVTVYRESLAMRQRLIVSSCNTIVSVSD